MTPISRRTVLRGIGTALALPWLEAMAPLARAAPAAPAQRMAFFYVPNGVHMPHWTPGAVGPLGTLPAILQPARRVPARPPRPVGSDPGRRPGPRRRPGGPRPVDGQLPDRDPPQEDGRAGAQGRRLGRPGGRGSPRAGDAAPVDRAGDRPGGAGRQLRLGLQLRLLVEHLVAVRVDADGQGGGPPPGVRAAVRRPAPPRRVGAGRGQARAVPQERPRLRRRRRPPARRTGSGATTARRSTSTSPRSASSKPGWPGSTPRPTSTSPASASRPASPRRTATTSA